MLLKGVLGIALSFVLISMAGLFWPVSTPRFPVTEESKNSIAEMKWVEIGGLEQWVLIRGLDRSNPILLILHGGPGTSKTALFRAFNASLESYYTVVYWDQRAAGKTRQRAGPKETLKISQYVSDIDDLVDYLRENLNQNKVALMAHSWGTSIGIMYAHQYPEKVSGFIGVGQISNMVENERRSYASALRSAEAENHIEAIAALTKIGPPPHKWQDMLEERKWVTHFGGGASRTHSRLSLAWKILRQPETNVIDLIAMQAGEKQALEDLWPEISKLDLAAQYSEFQMPVFFILGRYDGYIMPDLAEAYMAEISAPDRQLYWFEDSAHSPPFEEPEKFNALLRDDIRCRLHRGFSSSNMSD